MNLEELTNILKNKPEIDVPMFPYTSFQVGGKADYLFKPLDLDELQLILKIITAAKMPFLTMGKGTNLLIRDKGIRGAVIMMGDGFNYMERKDNVIRAGAGALLPLLSWKAAENGLSGLEFAVGIPGSLGGGLIMNAGAFGLYLGDLVEDVTLIDYRGTTKVMGRSQISFEYRWSSLNKEGIVIGARLALNESHPTQIKERMGEILKKRREKQPSLPSAGSIFRNEPHVSAGQLIEEAGAKGLQIGGAMVSSKHANFIVNVGGASASDITSLIDLVREKVFQKHGVKLKLELQIVGEE